MTSQPGGLTLSEDDRRAVAPWAADCAERVLSIFEAAAPGDSRPREAIAGLRAFARDELRIGPARALAAAAHAAARDVADPAAVAAARAAGQATAVAHMAAHARGVVYAAVAAGLAAGSHSAATSATAGAPATSDAALQAEARWQIEHASPAVRDVLRRLPPPQRGGGRLGALIRQLHESVVGDTGRE